MACSSIGTAILCPSRFTNLPRRQIPRSTRRHRRRRRRCRRHWRLAPCIRAPLPRVHWLAVRPRVEQPHSMRPHSSRSRSPSPPRKRLPRLPEAPCPRQRTQLELTNGSRCHRPAPRRRPTRRPTARCRRRRCHLQTLLICPKRRNSRWQCSSRQLRLSSRPQRYGRPSRRPSTRRFMRPRPRRPSAISSASSRSRRLSRRSSPRCSERVHRPPRRHRHPSSRPTLLATRLSSIDRMHAP
mmetsp:Transcript_10985/g.28129  ORF Transcript_10985/g.28129 Transcript_10985/m.28129 type:complete len:240 (+) Transcript_10985:46-765(+)